MSSEYEKMDLPAIRNLFLEEMRIFLTVLDIESPEQLKIRKERIKEIDRVLEQKKLAANSKDFLFNFF